jgi:hypothetical protein
MIATSSATANPQEIAAKIVIAVLSGLQANGKYAISLLPNH